MSVRKREWTTAKGEAKTAWVVDYFDGAGKRRLKTFAKKKEADAFAATARVEVATGTHTPDSASITVEAASDLWIASCEARGLERSTVQSYKQHRKFHILPYLGRVKLSQLSAPLVRQFEDALRNGEAPFDAPRSAAMVRKIVGSLGALVADAHERGLVSRNVVRELRGRRKPGREKRADKRQKGKLKIGVDIPTPAEIKAIIGALDGRWRPILMTAIFTGLRSSELRGLRWEDVDLQKGEEKGEIHVRQRVDQFGEFGAPKSEAGERTVPLSPALVKMLKEWKLACPKGALGLVFPTGAGTPESHANVINRGLIPVQLAAGVTTPVLDENGKPARDQDGKPIVAAKYTGLHALRHFYASWCVNAVADGGLGLSAKAAQDRLGHSTIVMTLDTYGHLFPRGDDGSELAAAEKALLG